MVPGIIKKLYHTTAVGLTDESKQEVYPITATSAVYSAPGESSFPDMSLDNILDALNQGYQYMGKATPTTNPGVFNHKVFYLASENGTYSHFDNIEVSGLTVLKTSGSGWSKDEFNITGGGGGTTPFGYIGTTMVQDSPATQWLMGISNLSLTSTAKIFFGNNAYIELDQYGFHFSEGIYSDSFVSAGGVGTNGGGGGGGGASKLRELEDIYHDSSEILRANGAPVANGDVLVYDSANTRWVAAAQTGGVSQVKIGSTSYLPDSSGIISLPAYPTTLPASDVYAWAKAATKPTYTFAELTSHPTTLAGYGITDAATASGLAALSDVVTALSGRVDTVEGWFEVVTVNGVQALHAKSSRAIYSDSWIAAGGVGNSSPSGGSLSTLSDVDLDTLTLANGDLLVYNSSTYKWENIPQSSITPDLSAYALKTGADTYNFLVNLLKFKNGNYNDSYISADSGTFPLNYPHQRLKWTYSRAGTSISDPSVTESKYLAFVDDIPTSVVKYTAQSLTEAQKLQARTNIGATGSEVFWFDPQSHQFSDIESAFQAGKTVGYIDGNYYVYLLSYIEQGVAHFSTAALNQDDIPKVGVFTYDDHGNSDTFFCDIPIALRQLSEDSTHRLLTSTQVDKIDADICIYDLEDNNTTVAGTWKGKNDKITALVDGLTVRYKVTVAGADTTKLQINSLGSKTIYRYGSTKLTTQYPVGSYIVLYYSSTLHSGCWLVLNDYALTVSDIPDISDIYVTVIGTQTISGVKTFSASTTFSNNISVGGIVSVASKDMIDLTQSGMTMFAFGTRAERDFNAYGTGINLRTCDSNGDQVNILAVNPNKIQAGSDIIPNYVTGLNLGGSASNQRWSAIYGVNGNLTGDLTMATTSHIDLGPIRLVYDSNSDALHVTTNDSSNHPVIGLYADGFVAAGGVGEGVGGGGYGVEEITTNQDGTIDFHFTGGNITSVNLNHEHSQYLKCVPCENQAAYDDITNKDNSTLYPIGGNIITKVYLGTTVIFSEN